MNFEDNLAEYIRKYVQIIQSNVTDAFQYQKNPRPSKKLKQKFVFYNKESIKVGDLI